MGFVIAKSLSDDLIWQHQRRVLLSVIANIIGLRELVIAHLLRMSLWGSCQPQFRPHLNWVSENSEINQREQVWQTDSWLVMPTAKFISNQFTRSIFLSRSALLHAHGTWYLTLISALKKAYFFLGSLSGLVRHVSKLTKRFFNQSPALAVWALVQSAPKHRKHMRFYAQKSKCACLTVPKSMKRHRKIY